MYVLREDMMILHSLDELHEQYEKKFGERFIAFNYIDFPGTSEDGSSAQQYKKMLEEAVKKDRPTRIVSHRYDFCDH